MARVELSAAADADLTEIYTYSFRQFGVAGADSYLLSLEKCFDGLAEFPGLGRSVDICAAVISASLTAVIPVYFMTIPDGIRIIRVLHQRMDPERHL